MPKFSQSRLNFIATIILLVLLLATLGYMIGLSRGRSSVGQAVATAQAAQLLAVLADTPTPQNTETATETPSVTPTPMPTATPTATSTPSPTPASPEEWLQQYRDVVMQGLNSISDLQFSSERAAAILQRSAQEQGLTYASVSYHLLSENPWAALAIPRNPLSQALPLLLWQDVNSQNQFHAQSLLTLLDISSNYNTLLTGVQFGILRKDELGLAHLLLIERPGVESYLTAYVLAQPAASADFVLDWRSTDDRQWLMFADPANVEIVEVEGNLLPDIVIDAPVPMEGRLRSLVNPPTVFIEQPPFAVQWINSRWSFAPLNDAPLNNGALEMQRIMRGYRLNGAALRSTPLTTLGQIIQLARQQDLNEALNYATRLDIVQQAFGYGLGDPGVWLATYLDENSQPTLRENVTPLLRIVDNANRQRTYDGYFELDANGFYRLAAITQAEPYEPDFITPAAPASTFTPTGSPVTAPPALATSDPANPLGLPTPTDTPEGGVASSGTTPTVDISTATSAATPTNSFTPSETSTATESPTVTETPSATPTFTTTPSPTPTDTETPTDTATPPLPLPTILRQEVAPANGILSLSATANLRGGPGIGFVSIAPVDDQTPVGVFGVTESGGWYLIRLELPGNPYDGLVGWIFSDLLFITNSSAPLTVYRDDGTSLTPTPPTATPVPGTATFTPLPTWSSTPTPLQTPVLSEPESIAANVSNVPAPDADEAVFVVAGEQLPAAPLQPLPATDVNGIEVNLRVDSAEVQAWSGLFGAPGGWRSASAELLWPQTTLYAQLNTTPSTSNSTPQLANRVRIVGAPNRPRSEVVSLSELGVASGYGTAAALVAVRNADGFALLDTRSNLTQLWQTSLEIGWLAGDDLAGLAGMNPASNAGENGFLWQRSDGSGLQIYAQPFHLIHGVAGDAYGGVWWIETPQIGLDAWQLWHFDPALNKILLRLKQTSELFPQDRPAESQTTRQTLAPSLLAIKPIHPGDNSQVTLFFDTLDVVSQQLYTGFYKVDLRVNGDAPAELISQPQLLLSGGSYQSRPKMSFDQRRLAYFAYDNAQPSLIAGSVKPPNQVKVLTLEGATAGTVRTVFQNETRFDFLGPNLEWLSTDRLLIVRSRFAAGESTAPDRFAVAEVRLPADENASDEIVSSGFVVTGNNRLLDVTACRKDQTTLALLTDNNDVTQLLRWDGINDPQPVSAPTESLERLFVCWSAPAS